MPIMKHFLLVHALCHGAWSWYKVKTQLQAAGHRVTAVDLAASGINMTRVEEIQTLEDYSRPFLKIMGSLGSDEKVIVVAHSMGGIPAALAAEIFPCKIAAVVFLTSSMPDTKNPPAYVFEKLLASIPPEEFLDIVFGSYGTPDRSLQTALFGPKFMAEKLYQLSPVEDLELAKLLVRVNPLITKNLAGTRSFTEQGNFPPKEVMEIKDADHMPMFSKPQELCVRLLEIADKYA